jgi:hypothetical protein
MELSVLWVETSRMTKYILQIGLETDLDLFSLEDKIRELFQPEIEKETFRNYIVVKQCQFEEIKDEFYDLVGIHNHSGGSFLITGEK